MAASAPQRAIGRRSGIIVRQDVRRDSHGFEDIDEFWDDDDSTHDISASLNRTRDRLSFGLQTPGKEPVMTTPRKTPVVTDVRRDADGFEDVDEFWATGSTSGNDSPSSIQMEEMTLNNQRRLIEKSNPKPPKKFTHLQRRQRNSFGEVTSSQEASQGAANEDYQSPPKDPKTPPFARKPKFSESTSQNISIAITTSVQSQEGENTVAIRRESDRMSVFSFGNMSSPASTVEINDGDSPDKLLSLGASPIANDEETSQPSSHREPRWTPSPRTKNAEGSQNSFPNEALEQTSPVPRYDSDASVESSTPTLKHSSPVRTVRDNQHLLDDQDGSPEGVAFSQQDSPLPTLPLPPSPTSTSARVSHSPSSEENLKKTLKSKFAPSVHEKKGKQLDVSEGYFDTGYESPKKHKQMTKTLVEDYEFNHGEQEDETEPFEGNQSPISNPEDHTVTTSPSMKKKMKAKRQTQKFKSTKSVESLNDSSFNLTDKSKIDSESEEENNVTALSNASDVARDDTDNEDGPVRRSRRKRIKPLEWYKCERPVYERRQSGVGLIMPTISHIERAGTKTPVKLKPRTTKPKSLFSTADLPSEYSYLATDNGELWDEASNSSKKMRMIGRSKASEVFALPGVEGYPCGYAGQTFNIPGGPSLPTWISGRLMVPPQGIKQPESVGNCTQVFVVLACQPGSLEVAYGHPSDGTYNDETAQRYLLSPGDEYFVPPNNAYYLRNHSKSVEAELRFMILKPTRQQLTSAAATSGKKRKK